MGKAARNARATKIPKTSYTHTIKFNQREEANMHRLAADVSDVLGQNLTIDQLIRKCVGIGFEIHLQAIDEEQKRRLAEAQAKAKGDTEGAEDAEGTSEGEGTQESTDSGEVASEEAAADSTAPTEGTGSNEASDDTSTRGDEPG